MLLIPMSREQLLMFLPKGGECAEIGVAKGEFSLRIMAAVTPQRLHLIDPWEHQTRADYQDDGNNVADDENQRRYESISAHFAQEIAGGRVCIQRRYSTEAAATFADHSLDWVYVDGLHSYAGVRADLQSYSPKIKPDGFILGHDHTNAGGVQKLQFGVVEAVSEFLKEHQWHMLAMTMESFPTFVMCRDAHSPQAQLLYKKLVYNLPMLVEVDYPAYSGQIGHRF